MTVKGKQPHRRLALEHAQPEWLCASEVRKRLRMSRTQFAASFGVSVSTLRQWEAGVRRPCGAALILRHVIWREPGPVLRAVREAQRTERDLHVVLDEDETLPE